MEVGGANRKTRMFRSDGTGKQKQSGGLRSGQTRRQKVASSIATQIGWRRTGYEHQVDLKDLRLVDKLRRATGPKMSENRNWEIWPLPFVETAEEEVTSVGTH